MTERACRWCGETERLDQECGYDDRCADVFACRERVVKQRDEALAACEITGLNQVRTEADRDAARAALRLCVDMVRALYEEGFVERNLEKARAALAAAREVLGEAT